MTLDAATILGLALIGGVVGLDAVSCPQMMFSRPIVAGPAVGALLGDPVTGLWVGSFLELISLGQLPIGAARHWDVGPAAVVASAAGTGLLPPGAMGLVVAVGIGIVVGWAGGWSVHALRHANARLVARGALDDSRDLTLRHASAMALDFARASVVTLVALLVVARLGLESSSAMQGPALIVLVSAASLAIGVDLRTMATGRRVWAAFGAGALVSVGVWLWLR